MQGKHDGFLITNLPDGVAAAALAAAVGATGAIVGLETHQIYVAWVEAAVNHWHTLDAKRFPGTLDWSNQAWDWLTPGEIEAAKQVVEVIEEKNRVEDLEETAMRRFNEARASARSGPFRLLTEQGTELADAVRDVLRDIGLEVRDMDQELTDRDAVEDLRVSPPDRPEWVALAEIKGYSRSQGKAEDLLNLTGRFGLRYRRAEGRDADAYWYVVNHHFGTDPVARKTVLKEPTGQR